MAGPSILERAIAAVAPVTAARRAAARLRLETVEASRTWLRSYDGASWDSRTVGWSTPQEDAAAAAEGKLETLRTRHRELVTSNPYAARAVQVLVESIVGQGIRAQSDPRAEQAWRAWAESTACDADGVHDLYGLQALACRTIVESGGVLIRRRLRDEVDAQGTLPLQLQVLEPDHLDLSRTQADNGNRVVQGVEFSGIGRRVAYWLFREHPGAVSRPLTASSIESVRVPASEVLHVFRQDRPGQVQGIPWGATVLHTLRQLDEYADAELVRKRTAACFTAFVLGAETALPKVAQGANPAKRAESLEPGAIQYLRDGESIEFAAPPDSPSYDAYTTAVLRRIAVGYGVPYASLAGDLSKVNFSSGRMGGVEFWRSVDGWRARMLVASLLTPLWAWAMEAAKAAGQVSSGATPPVTWTGTGRVLVDPEAEGQADHEAIRNGTKSLLQVIRERGRDPEEHLAEIQRGNELLDELGLTLDCDPRRAPAPGTPATGKPDQAAEQAVDKAEKKKQRIGA